MKSKQELMEELNQSIQRSGALAVLHTNAVASEMGLSATEFESMDLISHHQPMSAGALAFECGLTTGAITGIVDRLEKAGFVHRVRDPKDRRRVLLESIDSDKTKRVCDLYQPMQEIFEEIIGTCNSEQISFLIDIHNQINKRVEQVITSMHKH
jgi:DNA-binding MarR family transcriptional regulator